MKWLLAAILLMSLTTLVSVWSAQVIHSARTVGLGDLETGNYSCHETTMVTAQGQIRGTLTICGYGLIRNCETLEGERC